MSITLDQALPGISVAWMHARNTTNVPSPAALLEVMRTSVASARSLADHPDNMVRKAAIRNMLRFGGYKPTGRGKPASEYLLNAAIDGGFPEINVLVDLANLASLESLLPISIVDVDRARTRDFRVRRGRAGETYVFNASGQVIDLEDLLLVSGLPSDEPFLSPVKDCEATKTRVDTREAFAVVYAPAGMQGPALVAAKRMAELAVLHGGAEADFGIG